MDGPDFGPEFFEDPNGLEQFNDVPEERNPFIEALDRIAKSKKRTRGGANLKRQEAKAQAVTLCKKMISLYNSDYSHSFAKLPALNKASNMNVIYKLINRRGFGGFFVEAGGIDQLYYWLKPLDRVDPDRSKPSITVVKGVLECLECLGGYVTKEKIKETGIGKIVKQIMEDQSQPKDIRMLAQTLVQNWVSYVTKGSSSQNLDEDLDDDPYAHPDDEALEVDMHGRKVRRTDMPNMDLNPNAVLTQSAAVKKTEAELNAIWQPSAEMQKEFDQRLTKRHAVMPMEQPVFSQAALPVSVAPSKRRLKENADTTYGRLENQLNKIVKGKAPKKTDGISIGGGNISYKWGPGLVE